jgi:hypothetical protein
MSWVNFWVVISCINIAPHVGIDRQSANRIEAKTEHLLGLLLKEQPKREEILSLIELPLQPLRVIMAKYPHSLNHYLHYHLN